MSNLEKLPSILKEMRSMHNVTQKQMSEHLGVSPNSVQKFEYGDIRPSLDNIVKLCTFFNVSADYFLGLTDEPKPLQVNMETHIDDRRRLALPGLPEEPAASDTNVEEMLAEAKENWERVDYARRLVGSKIKGNA